MSRSPAASDALVRRRVIVTLSPAERAAIDAARGPTPLAQWIREAALTWVAVRQ